MSLQIASSCFRERYCMASHPANLGVEQLLADCDVWRGRRGGPGGQHRNKVETAVGLLHRPSGIQAEGNERRSQEQNRQVALFRLRVNLALGVRLDFVGVPPSELWCSRLKGKRISVNKQHDDFPSLLAEALDVVVGIDYNVSVAADQLGCSTSQLIKFLKIEPRALAIVNQGRKDRGEHALK